MEKILTLLLYLSLAACFAPPLKFTPEDVKVRCLPWYKGLNDTVQLEVKKLSQDKHTHWFVAYNNTQDSCRMFFFHTEKPRELPLELRFPAHAPGVVSKILYEDLTYDGENELIIELKFDYGLTYQGRELLIYQHPFSTEPGMRKELFNFPTSHIWGEIDSFDEDFGFPHEHFRKENDLQFSFFEDIIRLRGTLEGKPNRLLEYQWNPKSGQFRLITEEEMHEASEEAKHAHVRVQRGRKVLTKVTSHDVGCKSYVLEDQSGQVIDLTERISKALLCSPVTAISPNGQYLIFTDLAHNSLEILDLDTNNEYLLLDNYQAHEGVSFPAWSSGQLRALAFVAIDHEAYPENTRIFLYQLPKEGKPKRWIFDQALAYTCETHTGFCSSEPGYDFSFSEHSLRFRPAGSDSSSQKFETLALPMLRSKS